MIGAYPLEPGIVNGGIESVTSTLVPALAACDEIEKVTVLRFHDGEATTDYRREGPKVEVYYLKGQRRFRTITRSLLDTRKVRRLVAELEPDVVHGQEIGWFGDIAVRCSPNSVVTVHGMPHIEIRMQARSSLRHTLRVIPVDRMVKRVLARARVVISISDYDAIQLRSMVRGSRISIANPAGAEFFALAPPRPTEQRLLFAGVLTPRKNPLGLLNAFAKVRSTCPAARLVIAGARKDEEYAARVTARVDELGLADAVEVAGQLDNQRLLREIAAARAVVLFSYQETAPTIIAQAMAAGKPVVATRVGGVAEMVVDGHSGFLVEPDDEDALANSLTTLLQDQSMSLDMGRYAQRHAQLRFTPEAVARSTVAAYRTALADRDAGDQSSGEVLDD
jgi:glycosyltransferase involved in cell wall biosynthesis